MISEPRFQISKFTGMSDNGGMYYMDGFSIEKEQGLTSIDENYLCSEIVNSATTGYTNLGGVMAIQYVYPLIGSNISGGNAFTIMLNDSGLLYSYDIFNELYHGKIGGTSSSGTYIYCQKPDIFQLPSGNLIYTSSRHLSLGIRGLIKTGSSATTIIDKAGRNFTTLGVAAGDTVCNLQTGSIYTITTVGNGGATNDKLTFTAIGATTNAENDEFLLVILDRWDFNYSNGTAGGTPVAIPTYQGQPGQTYWARPIRQYNIGDIAKYMILSGNYIALLSNDETTIDCTYKQLPTGYQGVSFDINGSQILVSAYDVKGQAHLLLWDGQSDGWLEDRVIPTAPSCVKSYESGFIYLTDGVIYYTDGVNIQKLIGFPDSTNLGSQANCASPNSIIVLNDKIYIASNNYNLNRGINGILVFDKETGLTQFKCKYLGAGFATVNCIYIKSNTNVSSRYSTSNDIEVGCSNSLNNLNEFQGMSSTKDFRSFVYMADFGQETQIKQVWLNLKRISKRVFGARADKNATISVNYANDCYPLIKYASLNSTNTTTIVNANGVAYPGVVGEEVEMMQGACAGERTFITGITNPGTNTETWTVSPALSATFSDGSQARIWSVRNGETKNITLNDLNKPVMFNVNFLGSKMYIEVTTRGKTSPTVLSVNDILLF